MQSLPFFQVDAFAERPLSGNPAAVIPLDRWLDESLMQAIAAENNLSETAFAVPSARPDADFDLRWFTPTVEVDLCGHATLAAGHILLRGKSVRFATRSGVLTVAREGEKLSLDLPAASVEPARDQKLLAALGVDGDLFSGTDGNGSVIVLLPDEAAVRAVAPDFVALARIDRLAIVTAPGNDHAIASRVFAAYYGIDEDPVTGSAHAALVPFWSRRLGRSHFHAIQASKREGLLECRFRPGLPGRQGDRVILGGRCFTTIAGRFQL